MDIITAQLMPVPAAVPVSADAVLPLGPADPQAAARFAGLMAAPPVPADGVAPVQESGAAAGAATLGDAILGGLKSASADFQDKWAGVQKALDSSGAMGVSDILKLQLGVVQMSVQYEVLGKAVSRSTQNIDQLVKMQ